MSIQQTLRCSGEIVVLTDLNTSQAQKGRIVFVDKSNESRVIAGMRIFGTPQSRLLIDAYNSSNGLAFRTNIDQGTTTEGGKGLPYAFEILPTQVNTTVPTWIVEPNSAQQGPELGACMLEVGRYGTSKVPVPLDPSVRYIAKFRQNAYQKTEQIQIGIGNLDFGHHTVYGFQPLFATNGAPLGGTSYLAHATSKYNEPLKCITWDQTGKVTIPGTITATTYENLPPVPPAELLPLTLDKTNNRVGINQTSPAQALDVVGNGQITGTLDVADVAIQNSLLVAGQGTFGDIFAADDITCGTLHLGSIINSSKSNVLMYDTTTKEVSYGTSPAPDIAPITLDKVNNRVGINFATPSYTLDVGGDANLATGGVYRINGFQVVASKGTDTTFVGGRTNAVPDTSTNAVCIGYAANVGASSVSIGNNAGSSTPSIFSVAVGSQAGRYSQGSGCVAIGTNAGSGTTTAGTGQGDSSVAVGYYAGEITQGLSCVAIGRQSGRTSQKAGSIAVGVSAAENSQGQSAVALGFSASRYSQGDYAVAIGSKAGGSLAGAGNTQPANSIAINATGVDLVPTGTSQFHVKPIRQDTTQTGYVLHYNPLTGEITYGAA